LLAALREPDPVFVFEHAFLYPSEGEVDESAGPAEIGRALVRRTGRDLTIITYGGSLPKALEAAGALAAEGIDAEVIDLRTLRPLDTGTILASVAKTHRALVVDEGWRTGSFAAEVTARIVEGGFYDLDGPVQRVCSAEVPLPFARHLEDAALPQAATIATTARAMLRRDG
jgi:pyruvate/2-oxoglutarate/acetoin dehydrogenase E1 component